LRAMTIFCRVLMSPSHPHPPTAESNHSKDWRSEFLLLWGAFLYPTKTERRP
jgi:hypothetical protein